MRGLRTIISCGIVIACAWSVSARTASAATLVAPNTIGGLSGGNSHLFRQLPRVVQEYIDARELTSIESPVYITGIQFRLAIVPTPSTLSWPTVPLTFSNFAMQMSQGSEAVNTAGALGWGFASGATYNGNMGGTVTTVRDGPLTIPAGVYQYTPGASPESPNEFGLPIEFTTPYLYNPGESIVFTLTHPGSGVNELGFFQVAGDGSGDFVDYTGDAVISVDGGTMGTLADFAGAPGGRTNPYIVQFIMSPVPEPTSAAFLGLACVAYLGRRSSRVRVLA